ncbi:MAG: anti-sigma factor [Ilumatobacter sp.]
MNDRLTDRVDELIALAAMGEISDAESAELERYAADDASVARELDEALATAAALQVTLETAPPPALKSSVLAAIATTAQVASPDAEQSTPVVDLASRRKRRLATTFAAAAALVLLAGVGIVFVGQGSDSGEDRVADVVAAEDAVVRELDGSLIGTLTVTHSPSEGAIVVEGASLPVLDDDRTFALWLVDDDSATLVETFRPDGAGDVLLRVDDVDPTGFVLGVTEESATEVESPTLPVLASA